jgi:hypothetical protein
MDWQTINNKRMKYIQMGDNLFLNMYKDVRVSFLKEIKKVERPEQIEGIVEEFDFSMNMRDAYNRFYTRTAEAFYKDFLDRNKDKTSRLVLKQSRDIISIIFEFVESEVGNRITQTVQNHYNDIKNIAREAVRQGIEEGLGMNDIAKLISERQGEMDRWKARRIARTEVVTASNFGVETGAEEIPGNKRKVWISSFTQTSRGADSGDQVDHMSMDGQRVQPNESFEEPLTGEKLRWPGDPQASARNTINCRCGHEIIIID